MPLLQTFCHHLGQSGQGVCLGQVPGGVSFSPFPFLVQLTVFCSQVSVCPIVLKINLNQFIYYGSQSCHFWSTWFPFPWWSPFQGCECYVILPFESLQKLCDKQLFSQTSLICLISYNVALQVAALIPRILPPFSCRRKQTSLLLSTEWTFVACVGGIIDVTSCRNLQCNIVA